MIYLYCYISIAVVVLLLTIYELEKNPKIRPKTYDTTASAMASFIIGAGWPIFVSMRIYYTWKNAQ